MNAARNLTTAEKMRAESPKAMFVVLLQLGFWPVVIRPKGEKIGKDRISEGKEPCGKAWGAERWTLDKANAEFQKHRGAGIGVCLGPGRAPDGRWLIDVEGDGPEAEESRAKLFGGEVVETLGWGSPRGGHRFMIIDGERIMEILPRLKGLEKGGPVPGVYKSDAIPGLEIRIGGYNDRGGVKQAQSVVPPTVGSDGKPRHWSGPITIAEAPESFYRELEKLAPEPNPRRMTTPAADQARNSFSVPATGGDDQVSKWLAKYCQIALADEAAKISGTKLGGRHNALLAATMNLAGLAKTGYLSESDYRAFLLKAAADCGLGDGEAGELIDSGLEKAEPRDMTKATEWARAKVAEMRGSGQKKTHVDTKAGDASAVPPPGVGIFLGDEEETEDDRPRIICGNEEPTEGLKTWTPKAIDALARANRREQTIYQRGRKFARLRMPTEDDLQPAIETLSPAAMLGYLDRSAFWGRVQNTRKGQVINYGPPSNVIVHDIMSLGDPDADIFPPLESIVESPVFDEDGSLILEPGYHRSARMFYHPTPDLRGMEIPNNPTARDVANAIDLIFGELLVDFPFRDQASKANALVVMLLPFVRRMIDGPTPNHHFTASTEGTGKGKCAKACAFPFLGRQVDINGQKESEAEWRKAITSFLLGGSSHYFIDNLNNPKGWDDVPLDIDSGILAALWTGDTWQDRILGGQDQARIKINTIFMSSGNNVSFSRELTRRLVNIELIPGSQDPSLRKDFKHADLENWTRENRALLTRACLVICRNWITKGRKAGGAMMGSYEAYARTMSGILEEAGVRGFLENRPKPGSGSDRESLRWPALVDAWHNDRGTMTTSTGLVYELVFGTPMKGFPGGPDYDPGSPGIPELQIAFADLVGDGKELSRKQKFGHAIGKQTGRVWGKWRIVKTKATTRTGSPLYKLADPAEPSEAEEDTRKGDDVWPEGRE